ncbi:spore germination protein GerPC [Halobacillus mangrovi]|nr:spore germination protein GerPC [Halobacillus mangrovi]
MNNYYYWQNWIQQMMQQMEQQKQMIDQLQKKIEEMNSNEKPTTVIERIEYHFDQLKIETLEGTLQIGLTPNGSDISELGELYANQGTPPQDPVLHSLQDYMTKDIPPWMNQYVRDHDVPISDEHKQHMIADVRKQLPQRIEFYKNQDPEIDETTLLHQIQTEIRQSMAQYFENYKGDGE